MKKILDILIIVLLTLLVANLFNGNDNKANNIDNKVIVELSDSSYSIPSSLILNITNNTVNNLKINTCDNIKINFSWDDLAFENIFCKDLLIESGKLESINYSSEYDKFTEIWNYVMKLNILEKEYIQTFEIENKWTFSKLFTALFYAPIYNLMIFLISIFNNSLGFAIIWITIIIRIVLLRPQHKMMLSQKKLQAIQPKIKEIQKKHKWNQQMLGKEFMDLYKREKVNPMWSCGFLFIQMPILLVLYNIILSIKDPSNYYHIYGFLQDYDLTLISFHFFGLDLLSAWWVPWILLWIFVAWAQYFQIKLSLAVKEVENKKWIVLEKKKDESGYSQFMPDPDMMNKFMLYGMPGMVWVFTYFLFSWIWIYWWISTLFMLFQQIIVNKVLKKK